MVDRACGNALVEEEHRKLHTPEKCGVTVPCGKLNLRTISESGNVGVCKFWNVGLGYLDILAGVVDNVNGDCVQGVEEQGLSPVRKLKRMYTAWQLTKMDT